MSKDALFNEPVVGNHYVYFTGEGGGTKVFCEIVRINGGVCGVRPFFCWAANSPKVRNVTTSKLVPINKKEVITTYLDDLVGLEIYLDSNSTPIKSLLSKVDDESYNLCGRTFHINDVIYASHDSILLKD